MRTISGLLLTAGLALALGCTQPKPTSKLSTMKSTGDSAPGIVGSHKLGETPPEEKKPTPPVENKGTTPPAPEKKDNSPPAEKKEPPKK
jgi:hypothetical protein